MFELQKLAHKHLGKISLVVFLVAIFFQLNLRVFASSYSNYLTDSNTIGFWHLNETSGSGAYLLDSSGNGFNATPIGTSYTNGILGYGRNLNGTSDSISIPHSSTLKPSSAITIEAWVKPSSGSLGGLSEVYRKEDGTGRHLLSFQGGGTYCNGGAGGTGGCIAFGISTGGTYAELDVNINKADWEGAWHLLTATYDGSYKRIYRDGVQIGSVAASGAIGTVGTATAYIGSADGTGEFFNGSIDEVRISNIARSASEINQAYLFGSSGGDVTGPDLSASNSSSNWYNSQRTAVISVTDSGVGLAEVRYNWGTDAMNAGCTSGGTVTSNGASLNASSGGTTLYLCARDTNSNVSTWNGLYNWENTKPSTPTKPSIIGGWRDDHYINTYFVVDTPSGSSDTGGSGFSSYSLWRCDDSDLSINCVAIASGVTNSTITVSGNDLPSNGNTRYYYLTSVDNAGNTSSASSAEYLRMDTSPKIYSVSPNSGPEAGGTGITINGYNFSDVANGVDSYTKLLLHNNGTGNNFVDSSSNTKTITAYGNATQSSTKSKFGDKSAYFDGTGDYLVASSSSDFAISGDFTIDYWLNLNAESDWGSIVMGKSGTSGEIFVGFKSDGTGVRVGRTGSTEDVSVDYTFQINTWYHVAVVRSGTSVRIYVNGTDIGGGLSSSSFAAGDLSIGGSSISNYINGYIDELRISKGIARWTANFTPPTSEYTTSNTPPIVTIGGELATNINFIDQSTITANSPAHSAGLVDVVVTNPDEQSVTFEDGFTYTPANTPTPSPTLTLTPTLTPTDTPIPTIAPPPVTDTPTPTPSITAVPGGTTVKNVTSGIVPVLLSDWNTNLETTAQSGTTTVGVKDTVNANIKVAEMDVNFNSEPDWSGVTGATDENIAYFHSTQPISTITNGAATSYTLYVRKGEGDKILICPGATSLLEVNLTCSGGYYLSAGETKNGSTASVTSIDSVNYWKVSGLTSTGGMSVLTGLKDTLSRLQVSQSSDHKITFGSTYGMIVGSTDTMVISFPDFDLSTITLSDIQLTDSVGSARTLASSASNSTWGVVINSIAKTITFTVPTSGTGGYDAPSQIAIKIGTNAGGTNQITNPLSVGNKTVSITLNNTAPGEMGNVNIPIIDNDQVNITGYVTAYIHFDIDTGVGEVPGIDPAIDCEFNLCTLFGGTVLYAPNYTVDLGELTSAVVNKSNTTSVVHSNGQSGVINSIYFDISTNAPSGAVVTVKSANGGLQGPGTNKIPSIGISTGADGVTRSDGDDIPANSGVYGYNLPVASSQIYGSIIKNSLCDSAFKYCGADNITPKTVFTTNNLPVDTARVRMDLAAAANYTNNPGNYTDTLTFVATGIF